MVLAYALVPHTVGIAECVGFEQEVFFNNHFKDLRPGGGEAEQWGGQLLWRVPQIKTGSSEAKPPGEKNGNT